MNSLVMSWNNEGGRPVCRWCESEGKKCDGVMPMNEPLLRLFKDSNSDVLFALGGAA